MDITVHLPDEQARKLAYIQQQTNQDAAVLISQAIDQCYEQLQTPPKTALQRFEEFGLVGCLEGEPDLSTHYKAKIIEHLEEKRQQERL